jgi:hypothetical protein
MTFYCYRCNKLIHNVSPEFHNNFCKNRTNYSCYNNNNNIHNKFRYKKTRRNHYNNNKNNGQISDSIKNNNLYNYRSGRRHNHRNNYLSIKINTNRNNDKNRNIYSFNRYNALNSLKDDDFFLEYLDYTLENSNNIYDFHNINYSNNSDIFESVISQINEGNNFESNTHSQGVNKNILKLLPKNKVNDINKLDEKKCVICLEYFVVGDELTTIPCFHLFHPKCINEWFKSKNTCPICKTKISEEFIS